LDLTYPKHTGYRPDVSIAVQVPLVLLGALEVWAQHS
jgi:hypothetical protein